MRTISNIFLLVVLFVPLQLQSQDSLIIKGIVTNGNYYILPDFPVSIAGKDTHTKTNFKGHFKIHCIIGDTIVFKKENRDNYKTEKYVVTDNSFLIIKIITNVRTDKQLFGSVIQTHTPKHTLQVSTSISDKNIYNIGYNYYLRPFFPDKPFIPIKNQISLGGDISLINEEVLFFPSVGFTIRNVFRPKYGSFSVSFLAPSVKTGYYLNTSQISKNGFGYELGLDLLNINYRCNFKITAKYSNYISPKGAFLLSFNVNFYKAQNKLPRRITKAISE